MSKIIVLGAGVCGLAAGMVLRRDGHDVTILERDPEPAPGSPGEAWASWERDGVVQFRQPHFLLPRGRMLLEEMLPDVAVAIEDAGGLRFDLLSLMPPSITDRTPRDGDERFRTLTARRPVLEHVLGRAAHAEPGLEIRRGVMIRELRVRADNGTPHVSGVRTDGGEDLQADLVIDAMGRRSQLTRWLTESGIGPVIEEAEESGFVYYTRFFRARGAGMPAFRAAIVTDIGTFSVLTLPADNGTWSVTLFTSAGDQPLKRLRDPDVWTAVVAACPAHAQWLDGEPITGVLPMAGVLDRFRRLLVDGRPVATGVVTVGDAMSCTNPSGGRGMTLGLMGVQHLRHVIRSHLENPQRLAETWDAVAQAELVPWYRETVEEDRSRFAEIEALRRGIDPPPPRGLAVLRRALLAALFRDPDAFRAAIAWRGCITRLEETFADRGFARHILETARGADPSRPPGPNRAQLLSLLGGALSKAA
ncbi:MAG: FAD-dependent monooxygenase [Solirubrobacterales bacterium]|nr:FAD-dependent monooxygenase [Solirubrobacterales bacterium]